MSKNISKKILDKIKEKHVEQTPHWHFVVRNIFFWTVFIASVLIGAKAFGVTLFSLFETDFTLLSEISPRSSLWLRAVPFFWINAFVIFLLLAILGLHQTRKGYKISLSYLIALNIILSLIIGSISYALGTAEKVEEFMNRKAPFYTGLEERRGMIWSNPEQGRLSGSIVSVDNERIFILEDISQKLWRIDYEDSLLRGQVELEPSEKLRIVGEQMDEELFKAEIITTWKAKGLMGRGMKNFERNNFPLRSN